MLEHATEVEVIWKLDRGMADYSPVPVVHIKMIIIKFCLNLRQNFNIKVTCDMLPMESKLRRESRSNWARAVHQLFYISPGAGFHLR